MTEIDKFCIWLGKEIRENDLVTLGPYRLKAEHSTQKRYVISDIIWLKRMSSLQRQKGNSMSIEEVAKEFNELIESGDIEQFIVRSNKRILRDTINEYNSKTKEQTVENM